MHIHQFKFICGGAQGNPIHNKQEIVGPSKYLYKNIGVECRPLSLREKKK